MSARSWLIANKVSGAEFSIARSILMSGYRATPPTMRAIKKTIGRLRRGDGPGPHGWTSWRNSPALKYDGPEVKVPTATAVVETMKIAAE